MNAQVAQLGEEAAARPRLHVAVVTETWPPEVNGVARTIARMVADLRARGHHLSVIRPRQAAEGGLKIAPEGDHLFPGCAIPGYAGLRFGMPLTGRLERIWRAERPDVVQVVTEGPLGWAAIRAAKRLGLPVVSEFHTDFAAYSTHYRIGWLSPLIERHLRHLHNTSDLTLVPTPALANQLEAAGYRNVRVLARGVDSERFHPRRRSEALRARWGVDSKTPVVAYVGRLAAEKNLTLLVEAYAAVRQRVPQTRLLVVGDGPERAMLEQAVPDAVFAGMRHGEDLAAHYASADLFFFPSETETYGNVTLEALASGLPVIAVRHAAAADLIVCGENGFAAARGAREEFIRVAVAYAAAPVASLELRARIARSVAHQSWGEITHQLEALLRSVLRPTPLPAPASSGTQASASGIHLLGVSQ